MFTKSYRVESWNYVDYNQCPIFEAAQNIYSGETPVLTFNIKIAKFFV